MILVVAEAALLFCTIGIGTAFVVVVCAIVVNPPKRLVIPMPIKYFFIADSLFQPHSLLYLYVVHRGGTRNWPNP